MRAREFGRAENHSLESKYDDSEYLDEGDDADSDEDDNGDSNYDEWHWLDYDHGRVVIMATSCYFYTALARGNSNSNSKR